MKLQSRIASAHVKPGLLVWMNRWSLAGAKQLLKRGDLSAYIPKGRTIGWQHAGYTVQRINKTA